jgi:integrase
LATLSLADGSKAKVRNILSAVFNHAVRYGWLDANPIKLVRQSAKRLRVPVVLEIDEIRRLLQRLHEPFRTMVLLDAATGLRVSELLGLQWRDVDFDAREIHVTRGVVHQVIGELKTEASKKPIPIDARLARRLWSWKSNSQYTGAEDWVFVSPHRQGQPYWADSVLRRHIRSAAQRAGITKKIGWHTFRHTFASLLKANGEDLKVVQESLRHASSRVTLDTYTQAAMPAKRQAQRRLIGQILLRKPA